MSEQYIFSPTSCSIIDVVNKKGLGAYSQKTLAEIQVDDPDAVIVTWEEYERAVDAKYITEAKPITKYEYDDYLSCLPPGRFGQKDGFEFFHNIEPITGAIVSWYGMRTRTRQCFGFADKYNISPDVIVGKFKKALLSQDEGE
jgi:hypothetical protein